MKKALFFSAVIALSVTSIPMPASAQTDDIELRQRAYLKCDVEKNLGYASYDICVEAEYQGFLQEAQYGNGEYVNRDGLKESAHDPYDLACNPAATRIKCPR